MTAFGGCVCLGERVTGGLKFGKLGMLGTVVLGELGFCNKLGRGALDPGLGQFELLDQ